MNADEGLFWVVKILENEALTYYFPDSMMRCKKSQSDSLQNIIILIGIKQLVPLNRIRTQMKTMSNIKRLNNEFRHLQTFLFQIYGRVAPLSRRGGEYSPQPKAYIPFLSLLLAFLNLHPLPYL